MLRQPYRVSAKFDRWVPALLAVITFAVATPNVVSLRMSFRQPSTSPMSSHAELASRGRFYRSPDHAEGLFLCRLGKEGDRFRR